MDNGVDSLHLMGVYVLMTIDLPCSAYTGYMVRADLE